MKLKNSKIVSIVLAALFIVVNYATTLPTFADGAGNAYIDFGDINSPFYDSSKSTGSNNDMSRNDDPTYTYGTAGHSLKIDGSRSRYGFDDGSLAEFGMTTDWSAYNTLFFRIYAAIGDKFYINLSDGTSYLKKRTITAMKSGWQKIEIPFSELVVNNGLTGEFNSASVLIMAIQFNESDMIGSAGLSHTIYIDKMWLENVDYSTMFSLRTTNHYELGNADADGNITGNVKWIGGGSNKDGATTTASNGNYISTTNTYGDAPYVAVFDQSGSKWGSNNYNRIKASNLAFNSALAVQKRYMYVRTKSSLAGYSYKISLIDYVTGVKATNDITISPTTEWSIIKVDVSGYISAKNLQDMSGLFINTSGTGQVSGLQFYVDQIWFADADAVEEEEPQKDYNYTVTNEEVTITGINALPTSSQTNLVIPSTIADFPVVAIANNSFQNNTNIETLTLPSSLVTIGQYAFSGCTNLTDATFNEGLVNILQHAFENCNKLEELNCPSTLRYIQDFAFKWCRSLTEVSLNNGLLQIKGEAFNGTDITDELIIPSSVTTIGNRAFVYNNNLKRVFFSSGLTSIGVQILYTCNSLTDIYVPSGIPSSAFPNVGGTVNNFVGGMAGFRTVKVHSDSDSSYMKTLAESQYNNVSGVDTEVKCYQFVRTIDNLVFMSEEFVNSSGTAISSPSDLNVDNEIYYSGKVYNLDSSPKTIKGALVIYSAGQNEVVSFTPSEFVIPANSSLQIDNFSAEYAGLQSGYVIKAIFLTDFTTTIKALNSDVLSITL